MTKICILTQWMDTYGGLQKTVCNIANGLAINNANKVTVCALDNKPVLYELNKNIKVDYEYGLSYKNRTLNQKILGFLINRGVVKTKHNEILLKTYFPNTRIKALEEYINLNEYDVVIAVASELSILLACTSCKCKKIGWQHSEYKAYYETVGKYSYGLEELAKEKLKELSENVVLTRSMYESYKKYINIESTIIHNPLSFVTDKVSSQENNNLLFVGRLVKDTKGLDYLVEILRSLSKINNNWYCTIIGTGKGEKYLKEMIQKYNLIDKVSLLGHKTNIINYYLESSILLNTSRWEGFGLTIIEGMGCGVIPISFRHEGGEELITNDEDGILIGMYDTKRFANEIANLIDNIEKRNRMSINAKTKSNEFKIDNIIKQWEGIISQ